MLKNKTQKLIKRYKNNEVTTLSKLQPTESNSGKTLSSGCAGQSGNFDLKSGSEDTPGQIFSFGVPSVRKIRNSWSISESPGNNVFLCI